MLIESVTYSSFILLKNLAEFWGLQALLNFLPKAALKPDLQKKKKKKGIVPRPGDGLKE